MEHETILSLGWCLKKGHPRKCLSLIPGTYLALPNKTHYERIASPVDEKDSDGIAAERIASPADKRELDAVADADAAQNNPRRRR